MKIIYSLCLAAFILLCVAAVGTRAEFNDTEISTGDVLSSGTLNLQVGDVDPATRSFSLSDLKPGGTGNAASWTVQNTGTISGQLSLAFSNITNTENGRSDLEKAAGDGSEDKGELGGLLKVALWVDIGSSGWSSGDYYLNPSESQLTRVDWSSGSTLPSGAYFTLNSLSGKSSSALQIVNGNSIAGNFKIDFKFPQTGSSDYAAQSDSCKFDIDFYLNQYP